ncbi:MAG: TRAP transporter small permease [Elusimicrobiota bacterium]|jgi:TRAP-type C4-dicarboxylate transport system permease small subunit|nr:TRAP transporter small permease [Elusimicrobiota bacterium]
MENVKNIIDKILSIACAAILSLMTILLAFYVSGVYIFKTPSAPVLTLVKFLFVWLVMYGAAFVFGKKQHINLSFVRDILPLKIKIIVEIISEALIAVFAGAVLVYGGWHFMLKQMLEINPAVHISMGYVYCAVPISGIFILFYFVCNALSLFTKLKSAPKAQI